MPLAAFAALVLQAATSLEKILPIAAAVKALVHAAHGQPSVPKKADGLPYTPEELTALVTSMQDTAHAAWHQGDDDPAPSGTTAG